MKLQHDQLIEQQAIQLRNFWISIIPHCTLTLYRYEYWLRRLGQSACIEVTKTVDKKVKECPDMTDDQILGFTENCFNRRKMDRPHFQEAQQ